MTDWKQLQKEVYQNKLDHHFNVTDVNMEFCHLYGEVGEAYTAYLWNWRTWPFTCWGWRRF